MRQLAILGISAVVRPLQADLAAPARPLIGTLFLTVAMVLLIACAELTGHSFRVTERWLKP